MEKHWFERLSLMGSVLLCIAGLVLVSCNRQLSDGATSSPSSQVAPVKVAANNSIEISPQSIAANSRFAFKLFEQIQKQKPEENLFISSPSIAAALSMVYNGAKEETREAIAQTLEVQGISIKEVNQANAALKASLEKSDLKVEVAIANSLWLNQNSSFQPDFLQKIGEYYGAKLSKIDFSDRGAISTINNWVQETTNSKIQQIVKDLDPQTILIIVNAIYFKGNWSQEFDKSATQDLPFTLLDGTQKQQPLMSQSGDYPYYEQEQFQAISLPYGEGRWSFYVFLPKKGTSLESFYENLTAENWDNWMNEFRSLPGSIVLPRFKLEYDVTLNDTLKALGMEVAFEPNRADFSGMTSERTFVNRVKHKTFVEVNEEGTEAAAATSVGIVATSVPPPPFQMTVDRPFFCAIRDNKTGTILFMGSIVNPQ